MSIINCACSANVSVKYDNTRSTTNLQIIDDAAFDNRFAFFKYTLTSLPNANSILLATIYFYVTQAMASHTAEPLLRVTSDWAEGDADYAETTTALTTLNLSSTGWKTADITTCVKNWVAGTWANYGVQVRPQDLNDAVYGILDHRAGTYPSYIAVTTRNGASLLFNLI